MVGRNQLPPVNQLLSDVLPNKYDIISLTKVMRSGDNIVNIKL